MSPAVWHSFMVSFSSGRRGGGLRQGRDPLRQVRRRREGERDGGRGVRQRTTARFRWERRRRETKISVNKEKHSEFYGEWKCSYVKLKCKNDRKQKRDLIWDLKKGFIVFRKKTNWKYWKTLKFIMTTLQNLKLNRRRKVNVNKRHEDRK